MTRPKIYLRIVLAPAPLGAALFATGSVMLHETLGIALWSIVAVIVLLPLELEKHVARASLRESSVIPNRETLGHDRYIAACLFVVLGVGIVAGWKAGTVIAAVAASLAGGVQILRSLRVPTTLAITMTMIGASLSFSRPFWAAGLLMTHDLGTWLQQLVSISPAFALNESIAPDAPLTHRPLAYRLMNLGQDVSYAMPTSAWPCVLLHAAVGFAGWIGRRWTRINADEAEPNDLGHPEGV
jgi:hypothetical protein